MTGSEDRLDLARIASDLKNGEPVRRKLLGGYLDVERPLPILVAYRARSEDDVTAQLLLGHAAILVVSRDADLAELRDVLRTVVRTQADEFGAFLLLELWDR
ncbi:MAG: hypothetical protein M3277_01970, partial [Actinomycetota bacterium]|nr:hypothetical protein [Actinomycetota bacterium]